MSSAPPRPDRTTGPAARGIVLGLVTCLLLLSDPTSALLAQSSPGTDERATGRITGQVLDQGSGQPLPGAQIRVMETTRGGVAGVAGRFQLHDVPAGQVTLQVTLLGYAEARITDITIHPDQTARVDIVLERRALELDGITVSAQQEQGSVVAGLGRQRAANGVVNSVSAEQISRSPDSDAAAAVRRVSGVTVQEGKYVFVRGLGDRYTVSTLNGARIPSPEPERKVVPLDLFPAGLLQSVTTRKTFTPDQPGDFAGATVDIRTPDFPVRRVTSLSLSTGYHPQATGRQILAGHGAGGEWLAMGTGSRQLPDAARNYSGASSRGDEVNQVVNSFRNAWSVRETSGRLPVSGGLSTGGSADLLGHTLGYLGSLTYSSGQAIRFDQRRARVGTGETEIDRYDGETGTASVLWGGLANVSALLGNHSQIHLNNSYNRSADHEARREVGNDENTRSRVQVDRMTYVERTVRANQLAGEHQLGERHGVNWSLTSSAVSRNEPDRSEFVTWLDPDTPIWFKDFEGAVRTFGGLDESSMQADAQYAIRLGSGVANPHRIRFGGSWRQTDRDAWSQGFRIQPFFWSPTDERWQAPPEEFFDGRYAENGDANFLLSRELSGGSYTASDELKAAFIMAEAQVTDRLRVVGGARLEGYDLEVRSENQLGQPAFTERSYSDLLPALSATFGMTEAQQLRVSGSRTLARPEYRELAPITYREVLGGEQVIGNPELERTLIDNLDLRWEWYPNPGEVLSVALFTKRFDAPVEQRYLARSGTDTRTFENAESAITRGVEVDAVTDLGRWSPTLEGLGAFMNATLVRSRVESGGDEAVRPMVGQAPYVVNAGLTYAPVLSDASATLLYNVVGKRINNARASGSTVDDVVERPRHVLDLSLRFPIAGGASAKVDLQNLLDSPHEVVQGSITREYYRTGRSLSAGISWRW
jgi:outer membrane receptor for ferrienterochelin and colicin